MNELITKNNKLSVETIDFNHAVTLRNKALLLLNSKELEPKYLLKPEVHQLILTAHDMRKSFLIKTLWNTGARISEILKLKTYDFKQVDDSYFFVMNTLKQKEKIITRVGRKTNIENIELPKRLIPLSDDCYIQSVKQFIATFGLKLNQPFFEVTRVTAFKWIKEVAEEARKNGMVFPFEISPHTFRHSYAMHLLYNNVSLREIQARLGHSRLENTEKYTKIFALDNDRKIQF